MKKSVRRILSLVLILVLACAIAISCYAYESGYEFSAVGDAVLFNGVCFRTVVEGDESFAKATMEEVASDGTRFSGTVTLEYTYCPENQLRPSAYVTGTISRNFTSVSGARYIDYFASYYDLMIDATGRSSVTKTINNEPHTMETDAVTIYIY